MSVVKSLVLSVLGVEKVLSVSLVEGNVFEITTENNSSVLYDLEKKQFEMNHDWIKDALMNFETKEEEAINSLLKSGVVFGDLTYEEARIIDKLNFSNNDELKLLCMEIQDETKKEELPSDEKETEVENKNEKGEIKMENKNLGVNTMNTRRTAEQILKALSNKNKKEGVCMNRREFLKEEVLKEVNLKNLVEMAKLLTNFNIGSEELILKAFSYLLELVMSDKEGFSYADYNRFTSSDVMGKKEKFKPEYATKYSPLMIGTENKMKAAVAFVSAKKEREVVTQHPIPEAIKLVNNLVLPNIATAIKPIYNMDLFPVIKSIAAEYNLDLLSNGEEQNGYVVATLQHKVDKNLKIKLPMPELFTVEGKYFVTGVDHKVLKMGNDIYAGSVLKECKNTNIVKYSNSELINGKFLNAQDNFLELVRTVCKNAEFLTNKDFSNVFFNPKEDTDAHVSRAFFVRVGSIKEIFSNYKKDSFRKVQKMHRLLGMMIKVNDLAYESFVLENFNPSKNEELFIKLNNFTLGGGAGIGAIQYKTVNNFQRVCTTVEDLVNSNPFSLHPYALSKGSRHNNPDSVYLNSLFNVDFYAYNGMKIPQSNKIALTVFLNMNQVKKWSKDETKLENALDNYIASRKFFELFMTEQRLEDKIKYYTNDVKKQQLIDEVEAYIIANPHDENVRGFFMENRKEFSGANRSIRKPIERIVDKLSNSGLKGIVVETKQEMNVRINDDRYSHLSTLIENGAVVFSNNTLKKAEWAMTLASGMQTSISNQIKEGKTEFEFTWPQEINSKLNKEDLIKTIVTIEGIEYECYAMLSPINMHDSKNNYAAQGDSTAKQTNFNIQMLNGAIGNVAPWFFKSNANLVKSIYAAGYELVFGKWSLGSTDKVYKVSVLNVDGSANINNEKNFDLLKSEYKFEKVYSNVDADIIFGAKQFQDNKLAVLNKDGVVYTFEETGKNTDNLYIKERSTLSIPDGIIRKIYSDDEIALSEELLMSRTGSTVNNITVLDALGLMASRNISGLLDANPMVRFHDVIDQNTGIRTEGLLDFLAKQRVIDLKGLKIGFEPSMKSISTFLSKELNTAIRAAKELYSDNSLDNFIELIDNKVIKDLDSFFNVLEERYNAGDKSLLGTYFVPNGSIVTQFDKEHNIDGVYVLKNEIKEKVVKLTGALTSIFNYHRERLFSKNANEAFFNKQDAFYGTVVAVDIPVDEVRINPNSQGVNRNMKAKNCALFDRKPNTGELGYGLKLIWDITVPENCICVSPMLLEQNMGDNDGDCAFVYFLEERIVKSFKLFDINKDDYNKIYNIKEAKFFDKWNNSMNGRLSLKEDNILAVNNSERSKMMFNPEFVGLITSMNMTLANVCWKEFVEGKTGEEKEQGLNVYNFFINVVQKQLSQIPIAAKNTSAEDLASFKVMMSNINELSTYEEYENFVAGLDKEDENFEHKRAELNSYSKFIFVTGWNCEMESRGFKNVFGNKENK